MAGLAEGRCGPRGLRTTNAGKKDGRIVSNMTSYLNWRGDLSFDEHPFCDVDNLVLSQLAYVRLDGIVPSQDEGGSIRLEDALTRFLDQGRVLTVMGEDATDFVRALARSRRFADVRMSGYVDLAGEEGTQTDFSASTLWLWDGAVYVAYRGTANGLVGWREDFSMSFQVMPAQRLAEDYLNKVLDDESIEACYVGGHSKGGNLALYAAAKCDPAKAGRIVAVYSNDGPGLCREIIADDLTDELRSKVVRIVPEFSVFGSLFETEAKTIVVKSSLSGVSQHNALSWQVEGDEFVLAAGLTRECELANDIIDTWIESADMEHREVFTQEFFDALEAGGASTMAELQDGGVDDFLVVLLSVAQTGGKTRGMLWRLVQTIVSGVRSFDFESLTKNRGVIEGLACFILGWYVSLMPLYAIQAAGLFAGVGATIYVGKHMLDTVFQDKGTLEARKMNAVIHMAAMCILMYLVAEKSILMQLSNLVIGVAFLLFSYRWLTKAFSYRTTGAKVGGILVAAVSFCVGMMPLVLNGVAITEYVTAVGGLIWFYGIGIFVFEAYRRGAAQRFV